MTTSDNSLMVVVPAYNAAWCIDACLQGLREAGFDLAREVTVVDDGSSDNTVQIVQEAGALLLSHEISRGASTARETGAKAQTAGIYIFIDADVIVGPSTKTQIVGAFHSPEIAAVFGAYDDQPSAPGWVSQYRNLLHRYVHLTGAGISKTFWTGLGAVRRSVYEEVGGFNPEQRMMEDVELGLRISGAGHKILLAPEINGTHLKQWGWFNMIKTDLFDRAIPWTELLLRQANTFKDLNLSSDRKVAAVFAVGIGTGLVSALFHPLGLVVLILSLAGFIALSWSFLTWLARLRGLGFAAFSVLPHIVHNWCAVAGFAYVKLNASLGRNPHVMSNAGR